MPKPKCSIVLRASETFDPGERVGSPDPDRIGGRVLQYVLSGVYARVRLDDAFGDRMTR